MNKPDLPHASSRPACFYCRGELALRHRGVFAKFKPDHGPFDIYECAGCGSCQTYPMPSPESLSALYGSYQDGLPDLHRAIMADDPQGALYGLCVERVARFSGRMPDEKFAWADIGAGGGEFAALMMARFPDARGLAVDLHPRSARLDHLTRVDWQQADINSSSFADSLPKFDVVTSIAVWEHVLRPDIYVANLLKLLAPSGTLYLMCPDNGSMASRVLGRRWPYFNPGEHLSVPTVDGARRCIRREWDTLSGAEGGIDVQARPLLLPYTLRYVSRRLGAEALGKLLPHGFSIPLPAGALEAVATRQ